MEGLEGWGLVVVQVAAHWGCTCACTTAPNHAQTHATSKAKQSPRYVSTTNHQAEQDTGQTIIRRSYGAHTDLLESIPRHIRARGTLGRLVLAVPDLALLRLLVAAIERVWVAAVVPLCGVRTCRLVTAGGRHDPLPCIFKQIPPAPNRTKWSPSWRQRQQQRGKVEEKEQEQEKEKKQEQEQQQEHS